MAGFWVELRVRVLSTCLGLDVTVSLRYLYTRSLGRAMIPRGWIQQVPEENHLGLRIVCHVGLVSQGNRRPSTKGQTAVACLL
jgi:hypothetical protein